MNNFWKKGAIVASLINLLIFLIAATLLGYSIRQFIIEKKTGKQYNFIAYDQQGKPIVNQIKLDPLPPTDIKNNSPAGKALTNLTTMGILEKDQYGRVKPKEKLTRKQLAVIISELRDLPIKDNQQAVADIAADDPAAAYVQAVIDAGIMDDIKEFNVYARKIDLVKAIVKMDGIKLPDQISANLQNIKKSSPQNINLDINLIEEYPYIQAAYEQGIIFEDTPDDEQLAEQLDKEAAALLLDKSIFTQQKAQKIQELFPNIYSYNEQSLIYENNEDNEDNSKEEALTILEPQGYTLVQDNFITIKGKTLTKPLFINDQEIEVFKNNFFNATVKLEIGKNIIIVNNDLAKRIIYVQYENSITTDNVQSLEQALYLQNYQPFLQQPQDLQKPISRAEAAQILTDLLPAPKKYSAKIFQDLNPQHRFFQSLNHAYDQGWLKIKNNKIRPDAALTYLEAVISIVKFGNLKTINQKFSLPFLTGIKKNSPDFKYLVTALNQGIITQRAAAINVQDAISRQQFLTMLFNLSVAEKNLYANLENSDDLAIPRQINSLIVKTSNQENYTNDQAIIQRSGESIITRGKFQESNTEKQNLSEQRIYQSKKSTRYAYSPDTRNLPQTKQDKQTSQPAPAVNVTGLKVFTPVNNSMVTKQNISVKGVTNKGLVTINGNNYKPQGNRFQQEIELTLGKNIIKVSDGFDNLNIKVIRLLSYTDISNLKYKKQIEYLATIGYFTPSEKFYPQAVVSRFELASICALLSSEKLTYPSSSPFKDVNHSNPAALATYFLKKKGIVTTDHFYPGQVISTKQASTWLNKIDPSIKIKNSETQLTRNALIELLIQSQLLKKQLRQKLF